MAEKFSEKYKELSKVRHTLPESRLINHSLFIRDVYKDPKTGKEGLPRYKVEVAFDPKDVTGEGTIEDAILDTVEAAWGKSAPDDFLDGKIASPFIEGDRLAAAREEKGKAGDAYKGKLVLRSDTAFNRNGEDADGGAAVFDEAVHPIGILEQNTSAVYQGCHGVVAVTIACYGEINARGQDERGVKLYLVAFQKTRDGEKLMSSQDHSKLFKPVGRDTGASTTRRRRAG